MKARVRGLDGLDVSVSAERVNSRGRRIVFWVAVAILAAIVGLGSGMRERRSVAADSDAYVAASSAFGQLALTFEENRGQKAAEAKYFSRARAHTLFLTPEEAVVSQRAADHAERRVVRMRWEGGQAASDIVPGAGAHTKSHYYRGRDESQWLLDVPHFESVRYQSVYDGVDLEFYSREGELEFDFLLEPGADAAQVVLHFDGTDELEATADGGLQLVGGEAPMMLRRPVAYQLDADGSRDNVEADFRLLAENRVAFELGAYDPARPLVIDPVIAVGSYLGGSSFDSIRDIAVNGSGQIYVTGETDSDDFPGISTAPGAEDAFIASIGPDGDVIDFTAFFTGSMDDGFDRGSGIALDDSGNVYIVGDTSSDDFPSTNSLGPACAPGCDEAFVIKTNPSLVITYATIIGGADDREDGYDIDVNAAGEAYAVGRTFSDDFPEVSSFRSRSDTVCSNFEGPCPDGFITRLSADGATIIYSSYIGGDSADEATGVAVDAAGVAYVVGATQSTDFVPLVTPLDGTFGGGSEIDDIFWIRVATDATPTFGTYFGDGSRQEAFGVDIDTDGNLYIVGNDQSGSLLPSPNGFQTTATSSSDGFLFKLAPDLTTFLYSTYIGGDGTDNSRRVAVDGSVAYVVGQTFSDTSFPFRFALRETEGGSSDATLTYVETAATGASSLLFSTYYGNSFSGAEPSGSENGMGVAFSGNGGVYIAGDTGSAAGIAVGSPVQAPYGGSFRDGFFAKFVPALDIDPFVVDIGTFVIGSVPVTTGIDITPADSVDIDFIELGPDVTGPGFQFSVPPGSTFDVDYAPSSLGDVSEDLLLATFPESASNQIDEDFITFIGRGVPATMVSPDPMPFGAISIGSTSMMSLTVTASVTEAVDVRITSSNPEFAVPSGFSTLPLGSGERSGSFPVTYTPVTAGAVMGTITVEYFVSGETTNPLVTDVITVTGTGVAPFVLSTMALDFGSVIVGDSVFRSFTIEINGNFDFVTSFDGPGYATSLDGNRGPATTFFSGVTGSPTAAGPQPATMTISAFLPGTSTLVQTSTIALTMTGVSAFSIDRTTFTFGNVVDGLIGGPATIATITSNGTLDYTVVRTGGSDEFDVDFGSGAFSLGTGEMRDISAFFTPAGLGMSTATFTVTASTPLQEAAQPGGSRAPQMPVQMATVTVDGTGVTAITITPTSFDFGIVPLGISSGDTLMTTVTPATTGLNLTVSSDNPEFALPTTMFPGIAGPTALLGNLTTSTPGPVSGTVTIVASVPEDGGERTLQTVMLPVSGFGGEVMTVAPLTFDFGDVIAGTDSGVVPVTTVTPVTPVDLVITSDDPNFAPVPMTLSAAGATVIDGIFSPAAVGADGGTFTIEAFSPGTMTPVLQTEVVTLTGMGTPPFTLTGTPITTMPTPTGLQSDEETFVITPGGPVTITFTVGEGGEELAPVARAMGGTVVLIPAGPTPIAGPTPFSIATIADGPSEFTKTVTVTASTDDGEGGLTPLGSETFTVTGSGFTPFTLSTTDLDFGVVDIGERKDLSVTFTPTMGLEFRASTTGGGFSVTPGTFAGDTVRDLGVDFDPTDLGASTATMTVDAIFRGEVAQTETVSLSGVGGNPITTGSGRLGDVLFGCSVSGALPVTSSTALSYTLVPSTGGLSVVPPTGAGPGTDSFDLSFTPATAGAFAESIIVRGEVARGTVDLATVSVTGNAVELSASPATLDFGSVDLGGASTAQVVQLMRVPDSSLGLSVSATSDVTDFVPTVDAAGNVSVVFSPQMAGQLSGAITITAQSTTDAACSRTLVVPVSGAGGNPLVTLNPGALNFGSLAVGLTSPAQTVQLTNSSTVPLDGTAGVGNGQFAVMPTAYTVAPGASLTFQLTYTPAAVGSATTTATFNLTGASGSSTSITATLAGDGAPTPGFSVAPGALDYGEVVVGSAASQSVAVSNGGTAAIDVTASTSGPYTVSPASFTVPAGGSVNASISFNPAAVGPLPGAANFNVVGVVQTVSLTGAGLSTDPRLELRPEGGGSGALPGGTFNLSRTPVNGTTTNNVEICNTGGGPGTIESLTVDGADVSASGAGLPATLDPGECTNFQITFAPSDLGESTGQLTATGPGISATYGINGIGVVAEIILIELPANSVGGLTPEDLGLLIPGTEAIELNGVLSISFDVNPAFPDVGDPNVALPMGGSINFFKPAGTTQVEFAGAPLTMFNTGTTAGIIRFVVTLDFNGVDVSPRNQDNEPSETTEIPLGAPTIVEVELQNRSGTGFDLIVTGFSTAREVSGLQLQFTAASGATVDPSSLTADVNAPFVTWYETDNWQLFGSQFVFTQRVNITGDASAIAAVSVTLSNTQGTSNAVQASF